MTYTYKFPRPALTVDCLVFTYHDQSLKILLIQRKNPPFQDKWALPGGFVEIDEPLDTAARRELLEETGIQTGKIYQLYTFGDPHRDPRGRAISVAYTTFVNNTFIQQTEAASDAKDTHWFPVNELPPLAFDHEEIFKKAMEHFQFMIRHQPFGKDLLLPKFKAEDLRNIYEAILGHKVNIQMLKDTLTNKALITGDETGYYTFNEIEYQKYLETGFFMPI